MWDAKSLDPAIAAAEGQQRRGPRRRATSPATTRRSERLPNPPPAIDASHFVRATGWTGCAPPWSAAGVDTQVIPEAHVCQCEEVTAREILEVRPPRYLGWNGTLRNSTDLTALLGNGEPEPGPGQAAHPRRHGPVPGAALPRAGGGAHGARRPGRRLARHPACDLPRAGPPPAARPRRHSCRKRPRWPSTGTSGSASPARLRRTGTSRHDGGYA